MDFRYSALTLPTPLFRRCAMSAIRSVMMFKILVIQTTNNLSDERTEFLINDCLSFRKNQVFKRWQKQVRDARISSVDAPMGSQRPW